VGSVETFAGRVAGRVPATTRARVSEQLLVASGQLAAGALNLLFVLVVARMLTPAAFAVLAAFLALFLLLQLFSESISSGSALAPRLGRTGRRRVGVASAATGVGLAVVAAPAAAVLAIPAAMLFTLAATACIAGLLALERGRLYGERRHRRVVVSLLAEPATRLTVGLGLALMSGAQGAAIGVALGACLGLVIASSARPAEAPVSSPANDQASPRWPRSMLVSFLLFATIQTLCVVCANALLSPAEAARFAAVATIGGIAAFATATIPLVLLPRAAAGDRQATRVAVGIAAGIGGLATLLALLVPGVLVEAILGGAYASAADLAAPYMFSMALLGVARVVAAHLSAVGQGRTTAWLVGGASALQLALVFALSASAEGFVFATTLSLSALTIALGWQVALTAPTFRGRMATWSRVVVTPTAITLAAFTTGGLVLRLFSNRGLWVDEAISVAQARLGFQDMLTELRATDVHPPLHDALLWVTVRIGGTSEAAVRAPSLVLGTLVIPLLYLLGVELYNRRTGLIAAGLAAVAPLLVWYAQEARMYALFTCLSVLAVWLQVRSGRTGRVAEWAALGLSMGALVWTHYLAGGIQVLVQVAIAVGAIATGWLSGTAIRHRLVGLATATAALSILLAPLAPFAIDQFRANEVAVERGAAALRDSPTTTSALSGGAQVSVYGLITNTLWAVWGYHSDHVMLALGALWPLAILLALVLLGRGPPRSSALPLTIVGATLGSLVVLGLARPSLFEIRYVIGVVPLLVLLAARVLDRLAVGRRALAIGATLLAATFVVGSADQLLNPSNPRRFDFEQVLSQIAREARPGDTIVYQPAWIEDVVAYYAPTVAAKPLARGLPGRTSPDRVFLTVADIGPIEQRADTAVRVSEARRLLARDHRLVQRIDGALVTTWVYG
jgi:O-antigen/teichoic acid export membrane protein